MLQAECSGLWTQFFVHVSSYQNLLSSSIGLSAERLGHFLILTVLLKDKGRLLVFCPGILLHASPFSDLQLKKENYFLMALSDHH